MAPSTTDPEALVAAAQAGDRSALARLISWVEQGGERARSVGRVTFRHGGAAYTVGITGAPGSGKSTLTSALVSQVRAGGDEVGVLAVDPSSPFTGGALLGDRVRMSDHVLDDGVFIRSMATRGHLGGLALATTEAARVLEAAGKPWILIETVGVGQVEVEVAGAADTTVVVVNPGWGDAVQANKAGLLEIADIFVVNKADRPGAAESRRDLEQMLELSSGSSDFGWRPPIILTVAVAHDGVGDLWAAIGDHRRDLEATGRLDARRADRLSGELRHIMAARLVERANAAAENPDFERLRNAVLAGSLDPWSAADQLLGIKD
jgi:LAO/AO transport system kinase